MTGIKGLLLCSFVQSGELWCFCRFQELHSEALEICCWHKDQGQDRCWSKRLGVGCGDAPVGRVQCISLEVARRGRSSCAHGFRCLCEEGIRGSFHSDPDFCAVTRTAWLSELLRGLVSASIFLPMGTTCGLQIPRVGIAGDEKAVSA